MGKKEIIEAFVECAAHCRNCAYSCLKEEEIDDLKNCITINTLTAEIVEKMALGISTSSDAEEMVIRHCRSQILACAEECEIHDYAYCKECAIACKKAVTVCDSYLSK
ncbi:four-helix bundle copper-binding protein [Aquimarina algicola]|uniref:Four-helix bundle copper-binding protein n=1 Tax=Aquimarina algicola TaxID=2589995 RepID=A0A504J7F6_9FLAO|nr:four-helix bundle copper-binding protein [Aquimarina algicola]TPN84452.1 four-helix bundle copper-binding protein [Aquimarina algicola]